MMAIHIEEKVTASCDVTNRKWSGFFMGDLKKNTFISIYNFIMSTKS